MLPSWHLILFIIVLNSVFGHSAETNSSRKKGDTFTPVNLLPVATKFYKNVKKDNQSGIVSGAKCPEEVADKIFKAFFVTDRRIVELKDNDLDGLNQLFDLATKNEEKLLDTQVDFIIEQHVSKVHPKYLEAGLKIETLDEYFNNLIKAQYTLTTLQPNPDKDKNTAFPNVGETQQFHSRSGSTASKLNKYYMM